MSCRQPERHPMRPHRFLNAIVLLGFAAWAQAAHPLPQPPVAEMHNVDTVLHGSTIPDPYRWLEDVKSPEAQAWYRGQADAARAVLDRIAIRERIAQQLHTLSQAQGDVIYGVMQMPGERLYYLKRGQGENQFKLMTRAGVAGAEHVLVDTQEDAKRTGVPHALNWFMPSWNGRWLAYGLSAGGSEDASLYLMDLQSGKLVGKPIPRVREDLVHWLPDGKSLTFNQLALPKPGAPDTDVYKDSQVMWLQPGGQPKPVFGRAATPGLGLDRLDVAGIITVPGSRWMVARTTDTTLPGGRLYVAPVSQLGGKHVAWRAFATAADSVLNVALQGDHLYVMTRQGAPRHKIVSVDLKQPDLATAPTVVSEPTDGVLEGFSLTPGGIVTRVRHGTQVVLRHHAPGDAAGRNLIAPGPGTARLAESPAHQTRQLMVSFSSWTEPSRWLQLRGWNAAEGPRSVGVVLGKRAVPPDLPEIQITDVEVPSHDGVLVPMTILHRKGLKLDGSNPVLLIGYAAYGLSESAGYSATYMVWIEHGGVLAVINPRGSGVNGDEWYHAGFQVTKPNTWKDGIAGARWLIEKGYGSAATMGITGGSAGGIFAGRATTEAPELFAAAVYNVGMLDTLRSEFSANGATNISEFGSVADPAGFEALRAMSTYAAIKDGVRYPAVLLVHGMNDPRVDVWESGKTAARLQAAVADVKDARPVLLRLDLQAGHGIGSTRTQRESMSADILSFLLWQMGKTKLAE